MLELGGSETHCGGGVVGVVFLMLSSFFSIGLLAADALDGGGDVVDEAVDDPSSAGLDGFLFPFILAAPSV